MTPTEAFAAGAALVIEIAPGNERLIAAIWAQDDGIGFADIGWDTNDASFPFHRLPGPVTGSGPWTIGNRYTLREVFDGEQVNAAWDRWQAHVRTHPEASPSEAERIGREDLSLE